MAYPENTGFLIAAASAVTATGNSTAINFPADRDGAAFIFDVTAASGTTPTLDVAIQVTPDSGTTWYTAWRSKQFTAAGNDRVVVAFHNRDVAGLNTAIADTGGVLNSNHPVSDKVRVKYTIGGTTPSFTFNVWAIPFAGEHNISR